MQCSLTRLWLPPFVRTYSRWTIVSFRESVVASIRVFSCSSRLALCINDTQIVSSSPNMEGLFSGGVRNRIYVRCG
jgi:hypothetical protein